MNLQNKFLNYRQQFPIFTFEDIIIDYRLDSIHITFIFNLSDVYWFRPTMEISKRSFFRYNYQPENDPGFRYLVFQIGLVELISYWKAACPPKVVVKPYHLTQETIDWWKKLYYNGMGEFFHVNEIHISQEDMLEIESTGPYPPAISIPEFKEGYLVPVGGGKDSAVTLDILAKHFRVIPYMLNPRNAMRGTIQQAGFEVGSSFIISRNLDPALLELNDRGFLNGHTPFSALLAFQTILASYLTGYRNIALSNEASANESTIPGTNINHQYSKTIEFERDLRYYVDTHLKLPINYFSFLRPLYELQIARLFSKRRKYFQVFKSCNTGSKTDTWCCNCSKCLFAYTILYPFLDTYTLNEIFGSDLFENKNLWDDLLQLAGLTEEKPFECIGTIVEVNVALQLAVRKNNGKSLPLLLNSFTETPAFQIFSTTNPEILFNSWNNDHYLPELLVKILNDEWISCNL
ncbi:MAG: hypothetical protein AB9842_06295 [Bacteroidales bacterium]